MLTYLCSGSTRAQPQVDASKINNIHYQKTSVVMASVTLRHTDNSSKSHKS